MSRPDPESMDHHTFDPMAGDDVCLWVDLDDLDAPRCFGFADDPRHHNTEEK